MRMNFEKNLKGYSEHITKAHKDLSPEGRTLAEQEKAQLVEQAAQSSFTDIDAELEIYKIQKQKQERLKKFKKFLEKTRGDNGSFVRPEVKKGVPVVSKTEQGYYVIMPDGKKSSITLGDMMTDHEWDVEYAFDPSVDVHTIRGYYLEQLKSDLREKLDQQIITAETHFTRGDSFKQSAYQEIGKRMEQGSEQQGIIAEKMVKNFLKKLAIDFGTDFEIVEANAFQDVEQKVDFIIHRKSHDRARGAQVMESGELADIGIQFTINDTKTDVKEKQIKKSKSRAKNFQDIVLVTLPAHDASMLYKKWSHQKTPGGPEKLWESSTKEAIFRGVMNKVLTVEEIDSFCEKHFNN